MSPVDLKSLNELLEAARRYRLAEETRQMALVNEEMDMDSARRAHRQGCEDLFEATQRLFRGIGVEL